MNRHPSLQPTLGRTNVAMLVAAIENLSPVYLPPSYGPGYREGYAAALADAAAQVRMMWDAAVIATDAAALDLGGTADRDVHTAHCVSCAEVEDDPDPDAGGGAGGR